MRTTRPPARLVAGAAAAGLVGVMPVALPAGTLVAPAHADGQTHTPVVVARLSPATEPHDPPYRFGQAFTVSGSVADPTGEYDNTGGVAYLQVLTAAEPVWTTIDQDDTPSSLYFSAGHTLVADAAYKVVFAGAAATSADTDTLLPAESEVIDAAVTRRAGVVNPTGTSLVRGRVTPDFGRKPVRLHQKVDGRWVGFRTVRTSAGGGYRFTLPTPRRGRWSWRMTIAGGSRFTDWVAVLHTYSYRPSARNHPASGV